MDLEKIRREAEWAIKAFSTTSIHRSLAKDVLRILDAFEAMERHKIEIFTVDTLFADGSRLWQANWEGSNPLSDWLREQSPLAALLAAAEQTKENRDG